MASTRKPRAALFQNDSNGTPAKQSAASKRAEFVEAEERKNQHQPVVSNALKIKLDHLKTFSALTDNQEKFFTSYKSGAYCW